MTGFYMEWNTGLKWLNFMQMIHIPFHPHLICMLTIVNYAKLYDVTLHDVMFRKTAAKTEKRVLSFKKMLILAKNIQTYVKGKLIQI